MANSCRMQNIILQGNKVVVNVGVQLKKRQKSSSEKHNEFTALNMITRNLSMRPHTRKFASSAATTVRFYNHQQIIHTRPIRKVVPNAQEEYFGRKNVF